MGCGLAGQYLREGIQMSVPHVRLAAGFRLLRRLASPVDRLNSHMLAPSERPAAGRRLGPGDPKGEDEDHDELSGPNVWHWGTFRASRGWERMTGSSPRTRPLTGGHT
jgi:hypothetical protein